MTYAFLYFGRYNINEATSALGKLTDNAAFGTIFARRRVGLRRARS